MQVKSIAECSDGAFCNIFEFIKVSFVIKNFVSFILKTGFTVHLSTDFLVRYLTNTAFFFSFSIMMDSSTDESRT